MQPIVQRGSRCRISSRVIRCALHFCPGAKIPTASSARKAPRRCARLLDDAQPLSKVLWRAETEGKDFSTPERRAGLERALAEIVGQIGDGKIADYYCAISSNRCSRASNAAAPEPAGRARHAVQNEAAPPGGFDRKPNPAYGRCGSARSEEQPPRPPGAAAPGRMKEMELCALLLHSPNSPSVTARFWPILPFVGPFA